MQIKHRKNLLDCALFWLLEYQPSCHSSRNFDTILLTILVSFQMYCGQHNVAQISHCNHAPIHSCPTMTIKNNRVHRLHPCITNICQLSFDFHGQIDYLSNTQVTQKWLKIIKSWSYYLYFLMSSQFGYWFIYYAMRDQH